MPVLIRVMSSSAMSPEAPFPTVPVNITSYLCIVRLFGSETLAKRQPPSTLPVLLQTDLAADTQPLLRKIETVNFPTPSPCI